MADLFYFMGHVWNHALDGGLLSLINITGKFKPITEKKDKIKLSDTIITKDSKHGKIKEDFKDARNNMAKVTKIMRSRLLL